MTTSFKLFLSILMTIAFWCPASGQPPLEKNEIKEIRKLITSGIKEYPTKMTTLEKKADRLEKKADSLEKGIISKTNNLKQSIRDSIGSVRVDLGISKNQNTITSETLTKFWVLLAAVLVFFMQAGFKCLEVGMAPASHEGSTGVLNLMNWLVLCIIFYLIGYGLMFGRTSNEYSLISSLMDWGPPTDALFVELYKPLKFEHFLFQLAFAATTATIVDGAILQRTSLLSYFFITLFIGLVIYPVFGHWAWNNTGWLKKLNFQDFAGSTVVHSVGGWTALVAVYMVGSRRYRFNEKSPDIERSKFKPYSLGYSILGVIMLWFGWWGFNGGSQLRYDDTIASIILHTNLAGASAGIVAFFDAYYRDKEHLYEKIIGGVLGGLVAITASCDKVGPQGALIIGVVSGFVHNLVFDFLIKKKIDDVAGAIPVHLACGVLGTLSAGIVPFILDGKGIIGTTIGMQILIQLCGIVVAFIYTTSVAWLLFLLLQKFIGLRTSIAEEDVEEEINLKSTIPYSGPLRVSVRRNWKNWGLAWTNFKPWEDFVKENKKNQLWKKFSEDITRLNDENKKELETKFKENQRNYWQFIRDDDTSATLDDLKFRLIETREWTW